MTGYSLSTFIRRSPEQVSSFCSDLRNELIWNPDAISCEKLTDGQIGIGTRYRAQWRNTKPIIVEVVGFEPGRRWMTESRAFGMQIRSTGIVQAAPGGSRFTAELAVEGKGLGRLLAPLAVRRMRLQDAHNMILIRDAVEKGQDDALSARVD